MKGNARLILIALVWLGAAACVAGEGKLLATPGVTQVEGAGGSGLVPWATLAGYASQDEYAISVFSTRVSVDDYRLTSWGAALNLRDRVEFSLARQDFYLRDAGQEIRQDVLGIKARLFGNLVYTAWPQVALGLQYKDLRDEAIASAVGAEDSDSGTDFYLTASKLHLGAVGGYNLLWTLATRATEANQMGLLGFGGDRNDDYSIQFEATLALLLSRKLVIGVDYRQKPNNLGFAREDDWLDLFIAWVPNKSFNLTVAWVDLGSIAGADDQTGTYASLTAYLW